jgi:hypothetical protein
MRMIRTGVDLELPIHRFTHLRFRKHAADRLLDEPLRMTLAHEPRPLFAQATFVARVLAVDLLIFFAAGQLDLGRVHHDHVIADVDKGGIARLVLALEEACCSGGNPSENLAVGVDDVPAAAGGRAVGAGHERRPAKLNLSILLEPAHA